MKENQFKIQFDHFYILGPIGFNKNNKPTVLYQYPYNFQDSLNNEQLMEQQNQKAELVFPDGVHFIENDENFKKHSSNIHEYSEEIIRINNNNSPRYQYTIRFRCSPYTRPSVLDIILFEELIKENKGKINEAKHQYIKQMKDYFINDIIFIQTNEICPTCLFAYCFETDCPIPDFYFEIIRELIHNEEKIRLSSMNYKSVIESNLGETDSLESNSDSNDDFILVEKVNNNINKDDKDDNDDDQSSDICILSIQNESPKTEKRKIFHFLDLEKVEENLRNAPDELLVSWPSNTFLAQEALLSEIYHDNLNPEMKRKINEIIELKFGNNSQPELLKIQRNLCIYGAEKLFEFIELNDLIKLIGLLYLEKNVIVFGTEVESISRVITFLHNIIAPFSWKGKIFTLLTNNTFDFIQTPGYNISGIINTKENIEKIFLRNLIDYNDTLIIYLDEHKIDWPLDVPAIIPNSKKMIKSLSKFCSKKPNLLKPRKYDNDIIFIRGNHDTKTAKIKDKLYPILNKIENIIDCIFSINYESFIKNFQSSILHRKGENEIKESYYNQFNRNKNDMKFIDIFIGSQMFASYCDDIQE